MLISGSNAEMGSRNARTGGKLRRKDERLDLLRYTFVDFLGIFRFFRSFSGLFVVIFIFIFLSFKDSDIDRISEDRIFEGRIFDCR